MKKRMIKFGAILMASVMFLSGCGTAKENEPTPGDDTTGEVTEDSTDGDIDATEITFMHWGGDETYENAYEERIAAFESENPDVKVNTITIADDYETKLQTMIAGKEAPDVAQVAENGIGFASKNVFIDLSDRVEAAGIDVDTTWGGVVDQYTYDGEFFGLPDRGGCTVAYYNKDLFDEAGVPQPTEDWTLDDYYAAIEKITKDTNGDGENDQWGTTAGDYQAVWGYMLRANGGGVMEDGEVIMNSPENLATLTRYNQAYQDGNVVPYEELERTESGGDAYFAQGKIGVNMTGLWAIREAAEAEDLNFDIMTVPRGAEDAGWPMGSALTISTQSSEEVQDAAWKFIQYMTDVEAQQMLGAGLADCPANLAVFESEEFLDQEIFGRNLNLRAIGTSLERVTIDGVLVGTYYQEAVEEARNQVKEMLLGRLTPQECIEIAQENVEEVVAKY